MAAMTTSTRTPWPAPTAPGPVRATVPVPGSKSITNRALLLAAAAGTGGTVRRPGDRRGALRRRPAGPRASDVHHPRRAADTRRRRGRPRDAVRAPRARVGTRWSGHPRRVGLLAVRLGPAARRARLRPRH